MLLFLNAFPTTCFNSGYLVSLQSDRPVVKKKKKKRKKICLLVMPKNKTGGQGTAEAFIYAMELSALRDIGVVIGSARLAWPALEQPCDADF